MEAFKLILIGLGFGMFLGSIATTAILKDLIQPDTKIGKIINRGRGNENDIAVMWQNEKKPRKKWFGKNKKL